MADTKWGDLVQGTQEKPKGVLVFNDAKISLGNVALAKDLSGPATNASVVRDPSGTYLG